MICHRIVVGRLSPKLGKAKQSKKQQHAIRSQFQEVTEDVSSIRLKKSTKKQAPWTQQLRPRDTKMLGKLQTRTEVCGRCGQAPTHSKSKCPALEAKCFKCGNTRHFGAACRSKIVSTVRKMGEEEIDTEEEDVLFLGSLEYQGSQPWMLDIKFDGIPTRFKIDTGADVTVLPYNFFKQHLARPLKATKKVLRGPNQSHLETVEEFSCKKRKETSSFKSLCISF